MTRLVDHILALADTIRKGEQRMHYTKDHQTVKAWVAKIQAGDKTLKQVPRLFNLREAVKEALAEARKDKEGSA